MRNVWSAISVLSRTANVSLLSLLPFKSEIKVVFFDCILYEATTPFDSRALAGHVFTRMQPDYSS